MALEILTPLEMADVDRRAIAAGPFDGVALMRRAGAAVAAEVLRRFPQAEAIHVLCGPGNNGGDGYVIADLLGQAGSHVRVWVDTPPRPGSDAALVAADCTLKAHPLAEFAAGPNDLVVDALYGAGLSKPLEGQALACVEKVRRAGCPVIAVDLPSGLSGESGEVLGDALSADLTVTFVRKKPGHLLYPGRALCGEIVVADIGISSEKVASVGSICIENLPEAWLPLLPRLDAATHKYRRGHVAVFSGGPASTGAARLAAMAAARAGAGAVTMLSPGNALAANAAHLTSTILRRTDGVEEIEEFLRDRRPTALILGPGFGSGPKTAHLALDLIKLATAELKGIVLDADALTSLAAQPEAFFEAARRASGPSLVLTPHEGEFARLFPDIAKDASFSKLEKARAAARRSAATVIFKGPDTVIASPDGRAAINSNGTPLLATAGSGDVLAGICAGLLSQGMPAFEAAGAAVWMHAEAARLFGPGLIAEDLPGMLPAVLRALRPGSAS